MLKNRMIFMITLSAFFLSVFQTNVFAEEKQDSIGYQISKFKELENSHIYLLDEELPKPERLEKIMPDSIDAVTKENENINIPVEWYCDEEQYYDDTSYTVTFEPKIDTSVYNVDETCEIPSFYVDIKEREEYKPSILNVTGNENEDTCYNFLRNSVGLNCASASGVLGNLYIECSFNPHSYNSYENAWGICQWRGDRLKKLQSRYPNSWKTINSQLNFLVDEFNGADYSGPRTLSYLRGRADDSNGAQEAAQYFAQYFERCAASTYASRKAWAVKFYDDRHVVPPDEIRGSEMESGYDRVLPDGNYLIASTANPQYYLDIEGSAVPAANETNVSLCGPLSGEPPVHDIWTITYRDGFYRICQKGADVSLDVFGADTLRGKNIQAYANNDSSAQKWAISRNGRKGYRIQAKCSGYSLDIANGTISSGTNIWQFSGNDTDAQAWVFIPYRPSQELPNGRYILVTDLDRGVELDVSGDTGDIPNETNVQLWNDGALSQYNSFDITKLDNGYYKIIHAASGKALDVYGGGTGVGSNISLHDDNGSAAQQWAITNAGGDSFVMWAKCSGMVMDVDGAKTADGTNVCQYTYHGDSNQRWHFVKAEYAVTYDSMGGQQTPGRQTKYYKTGLKLRETVPQREGYIFKGWNDSKSLNGTTYAAGSMYTKDADLSLYEVWEKDPVPKVSLKQNNGIVTASVSNMDYVTAYGFVYGKGSNVTLGTSGRTRIAYSKMGSNRSYTFDAAKLDGCTIRAYVTYNDKNGKTITIYSNSIAK